MTHYAYTLREAFRLWLDRMRGYYRCIRTGCDAEIDHRIGFCPKHLGERI